MSEEMPRNLIEEPADVEQDAKEAEWLAANVPAQRLELRWRYDAGTIQLYERRLRSLGAHGVGPALKSYLRTRLEWFSDNKLKAQPSGTIVVTVETNGDVDVQLDERPAFPAEPKGTLFVLSGGAVSCNPVESQLKDACETFARDLCKTLAPKFSAQWSAEKAVLSEGDQAFYVNEEFGFIPLDGHEGPFTAKIQECFDKLWS